MKLLINALSARLGGGQTYIINLLKYLPKDVKLYIILPCSLELPVDNSNIIRIPSNKYLNSPIYRAIWEKLVLPNILSKLNIDILFCPGGLINTKPPNGCLTVTMFRNMIPFDPVQRSRFPMGYMRIRNWLLERSMLKSMINADLLIFISNYAKGVIENQVKQPLKRTVVIPHGISEQFRVLDEDSVKRPKWLPNSEYLLYVSHFDVYKSQVEVVQAFALLKKRRSVKEKLLLVGPFYSEKYTRQVKQEIVKLNLGNDVILTGPVHYSELPYVYYHSKVIIYASQCENCPNILLEALGAGRPIVCSDILPMPEFGKDAVLYFSPYSPKDLSNKLDVLLNNEQLMIDMANRAKILSQNYDWEVTASKTWSAILELTSS